MSGPRLTLGRLPTAACLAFCVLAFCVLASCTVPTPGYCDGTSNYRCEGQKTCCLPNMDCKPKFLCAVLDGATSDAGTDKGGNGSDARTDAGAGVDAPADQPATSDGGNDLRDAAADIDGPKACDGGCAAGGGTPVCDTGKGVCVGCVDDSHCAGDAGTAHVCDTVAQKCVQCVGSGDCKNANTPICDKQFCRGCKIDSECAGIGPEVCMSHVGKHCATDDETVYVKNDPAKCMPDAGAPLGSSAMPFCDSQLAINFTAPQAARDASAAMAKDLVVMQGPLRLTEWAFGDSRTLTVVGKTGATISTAGTREGITISGGIVYLRDLRVSNARTGIKATGGELHAERVTVDGNTTGGIFMDNTSFAITNSVIAGNTQVTIQGVGTTWSGVYIGAVPAAGPASLINDTVVASTTSITGGVVCADGPSTSVSRTHLSGLILWGYSSDSDLAGNCDLTSHAMPCCGMDNLGHPLDPMLTLDWRLMSGSPCIGKLASSQSTAYDIDGQPRTGAMVDCGADEFVSTTP